LPSAYVNAEGARFVGKNGENLTGERGEMGEVSGCCDLSDCSI